MTAATLIDALKAKQRQLGLSDKEMAIRLRVSRPLWTRVRNGSYPIQRSIRLVQGTIKGFPELSAEALSFLREDVTPVKSRVTTGNHRRRVK